MQVELHTSIVPLTDEWDRLVDAAGASPFLRPGWFSAWWDAFGSGEPRVVALRRDGELVALLPLERGRGSVRSPTNWHTPEFGLLAADEEARRALAATLFSPRPRRVSLGFLTVGVPDLAELMDAAGSAAYRLRVRTLERSPYVEVEGRFEDYLARVDGHALKEIRRRRRRLEEMGTLALDIQRGGDRLDEFLEEGFALEGSGWKAAQGTAITSRPETRRFYTELAQWAAARGWLRLAFLRLDGRPIAFQFTIDAGGRVYYLKGGYEPELRKYAPGKLLAYETLAGLFADGAKSYEFLGAEDAFKLEWTEEARERVLVQAFAPSAAGVVDWAAVGYARPVAKRVVGLVRR